MQRSMTFRAAYESYHLPALKATGASIKTLYTYGSVLRSWERHGFPSLDVGELRQSHLLQFRTNTIALGGSPASFDARWACLKAILKTLVAEELLERVPSTPRISKTVMPQRDRPSPEEVVNLLDGCDAATWPRRHNWRPLNVSPSTFWRCLYAVAFLTALRRSDLRGLRWHHVEADGIRIVPQKTSRFRKSVYCPEVQGLLAEALAPMRGCHPERVFPCLLRGDETADQQRRIAMAARVPAARSTLQPLRCASLDAWAWADERAPELIAGHGLKMAALTRSVYVSRDRQQERAETILKEAAALFPLPAGFRSALTKQGGGPC